MTTKPANETKKTTTGPSVAKEGSRMQQSRPLCAVRRDDDDCVGAEHPDGFFGSLFRAKETRAELVEAPVGK